MRRKVCKRRRSSVVVEVVEESVNTEELLKALTSDEGLMADM